MYTFAHFTRVRYSILNNYYQPVYLTIMYFSYTYCLTIYVCVCACIFYVQQLTLNGLYGNIDHANDIVVRTVTAMSMLWCAYNFPWPWTDWFIRAHTGRNKRTRRKPHEMCWLHQYLCRRDVLATCISFSSVKNNLVLKSYRRGVF